MNTKKSSHYLVAVCSIFVFTVVPCLFNASLQAACILTVDGVEQGSTSETSRTSAAAAEVFSILFNSEPDPWGLFETPTCSGEVLSFEEGDECVESRFYVLPGRPSCSRSVCTDGEWHRYETCGMVPECALEFIEDDGVWDVVCDAPPAIGDGPFLAEDRWPVLPTDPENPFFLKQNEYALWTFSDDYTLCSELCTHTAEYQAVGDAGWTDISVIADPTGEWYAYVELPVDEMINATTHALRFEVTDCAGQGTQSGEYYFRTSVGKDSPAVIIDGPFAATDSWPKLPRWWQTDEAPLLSQDTNILWTFMDDYLDCIEAPTHIARYRLDDGSAEQDWVWTSLSVTTDPTGKEYAYAEVPAGSLADGTYWFWFEVVDCEGHRTYSKVHSFKVAH